MPSATPSVASRNTGPRIPDLRHPREIAVTVAITAVFCLLIATVLTAFRITTHSFASHLAFSESIGMCIVAWSVVLFQLPMPARAGMGSWIARVVPAILLGYLCGLALASVLVGAPFSLFSPAPERVTAVVATVIASGFLGYLAWIRQNLAEEAAARAEAQRMASEAELRLLRAQIEPHMLFNTLATLHTLVAEDPALARHMIDRLISWLRWSLTASRSEWTTLGEEFAHLRTYLELMCLRMGPRLEVQVDLPQALALTPIPPMLLQPLVENAIRHGLEPAVAGGTLRLSARPEGAGIEVTVADNGLGLPAAGATRPGAYGLEHVRQRLRATYGAAGSLALQQVTPHGLCVQVRIPA